MSQLRTEKLVTAFVAYQTDFVLLKVFQHIWQVSSHRAGCVALAASALTSTAWHKSVTGKAGSGIRSQIPP